MAAGILLDPERLALDDVLEANLAGHLGEDRDRVGVPLHQDGARLHLLILLDLEDRTGGNLELLELAPLGVDDGDLAVASQHDRFALLVLRPSAGG